MPLYQTYQDAKEAAQGYRDACYDQIDEEREISSIFYREGIREALIKKTTRSTNNGS